MSIQTVLLPLFVEVLLTFALMFGMMYFRMNAFRSGETRLSQIAMREPNWPKRATQFAYAFSNQFELPVLFYVLTLLSIATHHADKLFVTLAWLFVIFRILQAAIHVTNNDVRLRGGFYGIGALVLFVMWVIFIIRIMLGVG